jgi:hypothetical protein
MREPAVNWMTVTLRAAGWTLPEIERLRRYLQTRQPTQLDRAEMDTRRLEFARWLVRTGRITG